MRSYLAKWIVLHSILLACISAFSPAYSCAAGSSHTAGTGQTRFALHILKTGFDELKLGYQLQQSWEILKKVNLKNSALTITENDIEAYIWNSQTLQLTPKASARFRTALDSQWLNHRAFVVTINGKKMYGGLLLDTQSAMAIRYPVIYVQADINKPVQLHIRPYHSISTNPDSYRIRLIADQEIYELFRHKGKIGN